MKFSNLFFETLRETPGEAEIVSHRLMLRASMIRRTGSGIYTYLPLGYRALRKVETIVRQEMDRAGAQEMLMPAMQPQELWEESGRLEVYMRENILFRVRDRQDRHYALGPTHEEVVCDVARARIKSYRDMPFTLYQIQTKFRDEIRPRFGLMRGREFLMKDAYSFDVDLEGLNESYRKMYGAYVNIFERCGLKCRPVEADSGAIGGDASHEFMVLAESGEDTVVSCESCDYAANMERAEMGGEYAAPDGGAALLEPEAVATPDVKTIEDLTAFFGIGADSFVKTLVYVADEKPVVALVRGDHQVNEIKLKRLLGATVLELADEKTVEAVTGAPVGFAGPQCIGGRAEIVMDRSVVPMANFISGGGAADVHVKNINTGRDFAPGRIADIREAVSGDQCPRCGGSLKLYRGVEVGHVFKLGTKYSKKMNVTYTDAEGRDELVVMGCYGIGVGRTLAAIVEQNNDDDGIIWPVAVAPYVVDIVPVSVKDADQMALAEKLYGTLTAAGIDVIMDDRDERPGVKFKDADLIGFPVKIVVGKGAKEGKFEVKTRATKEQRLTDFDDTVAFVKEIAGVKA